MTNWPHARDLYHEELEKHVNEIVARLPVTASPEEIDQAVDCVPSGYTEQPFLCLVVVYSSLLPYQQLAETTIAFFNNQLRLSNEIDDKQALASLRETAVSLFRADLSVAANSEISMRRYGGGNEGTV